MRANTEALCQWKAKLTIKLIYELLSWYHLQPKSFRLWRIEVKCSVSDMMEYVWYPYKFCDLFELRKANWIYCLFRAMEFLCFCILPPFWLNSTPPLLAFPLQHLFLPLPIASLSYSSLQHFSIFITSPSTAPCLFFSSLLVPSITKFIQTPRNTLYYPFPRRFHPTQNGKNGTKHKLQN